MTSGGVGEGKKNWSIFIAHFSEIMRFLTLIQMKLERTLSSVL